MIDFNTLLRQLAGGIPDTATSVVFIAIDLKQPDEPKKPERIPDDRLSDSMERYASQSN